MKTRTAQGKTVTAVSTFTEEEVSLHEYFKNILKHQDLNYWKNNPVLFTKWIRTQLRDRVDTLEFIIS